MTGRDPRQLAADVRKAIVERPILGEQSFRRKQHDLVDKGWVALDELVARLGEAQALITDLQAQVAALTVERDEALREAAINYAEWQAARAALKELIHLRRVEWSPEPE